MSRDALIRALALHAGQLLTPDVGRAVVDLLFPWKPIDCKRWQAKHFAAVTIQVEPYAQGPELDALHAAFHAEIGEPDAVDHERLVDLQRAGQLLTVTARDGSGALIGLLRAFTFIQHRTGKRLGRDDIFFIYPAHRGGMVAVHMARFAEACLVDLGAEQAELNVRLANGMGRIANFMGYQPGTQRWTKPLTPRDSATTHSPSGA